MILYLLELMLTVWLLVGIIRAVAGMLQAIVGFGVFLAVMVWTLAVAVVSLPFVLFRR